MRLAIPVFRGRVSPACDFCKQIIVTEVSGRFPPDRFRDQHVITVSGDLIRILKQLKVGVLLCGGISRQLLSEIEENSIQVIPGVWGEIQDVLSAAHSRDLTGRNFNVTGGEEGKPDRKPRSRGGSSRDRGRA